jgi:hypothetical protein
VTESISEPDALAAFRAIDTLATFSAIYTLTALGTVIEKIADSSKQTGTDAPADAAGDYCPTLNHLCVLLHRDARDTLAGLLRDHVVFFYLENGIPNTKGDSILVLIYNFPAERNPLSLLF